MGYAQDLVSQGYGGYAGWGDTEAQADFKATGGGGKKTSPSSSSNSSSSGFSPATTNFTDIYKSIAETQRQNNQPIIDLLNQSKAGMGTAYSGYASSLEASKAPYAARYDEMLKSLTGQVATNTSKEFARRGISPNSGMVESAIQEKTAPIVGSVTAEKNAAMSNLEQMIAQLPIAQQDKSTAIDQAIASLMAGGNSSNISTALGLLGNQTTADQNAASQAWKEKVYKETTLPESKATVSNTYAGNQPSQFETILASMLQNQFGGGVSNTNQPTEAKPTWKIPSTSKAASGANHYSPGGEWVWDVQFQDWSPAVD